MSADLLAEFDSFYTGANGQSSNKPPQPSSQSSRFAQPAQQPSASSTDPFSFPTPTSSAAPVQPNNQSQPWPSLPSYPSSNSWGTLTGLDRRAKPARDVGDDEDGWGDFEVASPAVEAAPSAPDPVSLNQQTVTPKAAERPPATRIVRASTMDMISNNLLDIGTPSSKKASKLDPWKEKSEWEFPPAQPAQPRPRQNADPNVLFDADDFDGEAEAEADGDDDDDDFGDFETVDAPKPAADLLSLDFGPSAAPAKKEFPIDLLSTLSINTATPSSPYPQAPKSPSFQERNPFPGLGLKTPVASEPPKAGDKAKSPSPITAWPSVDNKNHAADEDDFAGDWGAFEDLPPDTPAQSAPTKTQPAKQTSQESSWDWDAVESVPSTTAAVSSGQAKPSIAASIPDNTPPPTNVPPPSILLSIFSQHFEQADTSLLKPTSAQPAAVKTRVLSDPTTVSFLRAHLLLTAVAARIIAGRKQRWHRDKFLAQGMSISAAGGKGGMKLAGIDKAQSAREDREAADVVTAWKAHVGRLRSIVAAANNAGAGKGGSGLLRVPELSENMLVQAAKAVPTAPKACVVCGLKRDERVKGVDIEVEDSFGEWWVDHWGHRACRNFWLEHEGMLRQR